MTRACSGRCATAAGVTGPNPPPGLASAPTDAERRTLLPLAGWAGPAASAALWWAYDHAPPGFDGFLHLGRRYLAPLGRPTLPLRRLSLPDLPGAKLLALGEGVPLDTLSRRLVGDLASAGPDATVSLPAAARLLRGGVLGGDLVLALVPRALAGWFGPRYLRVPGLVSFFLPVAGGIEGGGLAGATTVVRRDARRVLEAGVTWSVSHVLAEFEAFYEQLYAPAVQRRFGDLAVLRERAMLRRQFRHGGGLVWLQRDGRRFAGAVFQMRGGVFHGLVAAADPAVPLEGRVTPQFAVKVASLDVAARLGASGIDLGGTVPSLTNGGMRSKRAFGATVRRLVDSHRDLLLGWLPGTPAIRRLLHQDPLLFESPSGLRAVAAAPPAELVSAGNASRIWRQLAPAGVRRMVVLGAEAWSSHDPEGRPDPDGPVSCARTPAPPPSGAPRRAAVSGPTLDGDVVVVGAGAAGLAAARYLMGRGIDVAVLEARPRTGGRASSTATLAGGHPADLGCAWLHSADRNPWTGIAAGLGLAVDRPCRTGAWGFAHERQLGPDAAVARERAFASSGARSTRTPEPTFRSPSSCRRRDPWRPTSPPSSASSPAPPRGAVVADLARYANTRQLAGGRGLWTPDRAVRGGPAGHWAPR